MIACLVNIEGCMQDLPPPPPQVSEVVIEGRGLVTGVGSGVFHFGVLLLGRHADGSIRAYVETELEEGQLYPAVGARCTLHHQPMSVDFLAGVAQRPGTLWPVVVRSGCDQLTPIEAVDWVS